MGRPKKERSALEPEDAVLPDVGDVEDDDDEDVRGGDGGADPGEWTILQTGEPAIEAIVSYVFEEPFRKTGPDPKTGKRRPIEALEVKEREKGDPSGREISVFSHNTKKDGPDVPGEFGAFLDDKLQPVPDPVRYVWSVARNPVAELRDFDSRLTFHVVNRAWRDRNAGLPNVGGLPVLVGNTDLPAGIRGPGMGLPPVSIFNGPSPLGLQPSIYQPPPITPQGIHGDIGGTGIRDAVGAFADAFSRMAAVMEKNQLFYADLSARQAQVMMKMMEQVGHVLLRHPDAEAERHRLDHEFRMKQFDGQGEIELEKRRETSGVVKDLGGKLLENPGLTATLMGVARKLGVTKEDVIAAIGGDEE